VVSAGRRLGAGLSFRLSGGAILGGDFSGEGRSYDLEPGWTASLSGARQWFGEPDKTPFFTTVLSLSASRARIVEAASGDDVAISATDLRLAVLFGYTFGGVFSPYLVGRAFGGPVGFRQDGRDRTGGDRHHYAVGLGASVTLAERIDLLVDGTFLGERSLSGGASLSF
jgi:hypothetical protein